MKLEVIDFGLYLDWGWRHAVATSTTGRRLNMLSLGFLAMSWWEGERA